MPEIKIPFQSEFKEPMLSGNKTAITRTRRFGYPGDWFRAFGRVFILTEVYPSFLDVVITAHYSEEGFNSPDEFIELWDRIHPRVIYLQRPGRSVYFHRFSLVRKAYPSARTVEQTIPLAGVAKLK